MSASLRLRRIAALQSNRRFVPEPDSCTAANCSVIRSFVSGQESAAEQAARSLHRRHQSAFMPWSTQGLAAAPGEPPPITDAPSSSHTTNCPLVLLIQRMSLLLSPLKSPVSAIAHGIGTEPGEPPPITDVPFTNHTTVCQVLVL